MHSCRSQQTGVDSHVHPGSCCSASPCSVASHSPKALPWAVATLWQIKSCNSIQLWLAATPLAQRHLSAPVQVDKILGKGAPPEFIEEVRELCLRHHCDLEVDVIR